MPRNATKRDKEIARDLYQKMFKDFPGVIQIFQSQAGTGYRNVQVPMGDLFKVIVRAVVKARIKK